MLSASASETAECICILLHVVDAHKESSYRHTLLTILSFEPELGQRAVTLRRSISTDGAVSVNPFHACVMSALQIHRLITAQM